MIFRGPQGLFLIITFDCAYDNRLAIYQTRVPTGRAEERHYRLSTAAQLNLDFPQKSTVPNRFNITTQNINGHT